MKTLNFLLIILFSTICSGLLAQDNQVQFSEKEKGFITKDGCKVLVKHYYGLSENRYYFAIGTNKNYYFLDTNEVSAYQDIRIGNNKNLDSKKHPEIIRGVWVGAVCLGVLLVPTVSLIIASYFDDGVWQPMFFGLNVPFGYVWYKVYQDAVHQVRLVKAHQTAQPYLCP
jgi:hypothetical protein